MTTAMSWDVARAPHLGIVPALLISAMTTSSVATATVIDLSWHVCSPVVTHVDPGPGSLALVVSATGQAQPHKAYEFWIAVSRPDGGLSDAWRFDAAGCQGSGRLEISHLRPIDAKSCPNFQRAEPSIQIKSFQPAPEFLALPPTTAVAVLANTYPSGVTFVNPSTRWFLGALIFDHTSSVVGAGTPGVSCGGYEETVCFRIVHSRCNWLTLDGEEVPFVAGQWWLTFREDTPCFGPVPARDATWGLLKGRYRR